LVEFKKTFEDLNNHNNILLKYKEDNAEENKKLQNIIQNKDNIIKEQIEEFKVISNKLSTAKSNLDQMDLKYKDLNRQYVDLNSLIENLTKYKNESDININ